MASKLMEFDKFVSIRQRNNTPNFVEVYVRSQFFLKKKKIIRGKYRNLRNSAGWKNPRKFILHLLPPHCKHYEYFSLQLGQVR
jgi:hypothetical protein